MAVGRGIGEILELMLRGIPEKYRGVEGQYGKFKQAIAPSFQSARRGAVRGYGGSPYGGGLSSLKAAIGTQQAGVEASGYQNIMQNYLDRLKQYTFKAADVSQQEKSREAQGKAAGLGGIGKLAGTIGGIGLSLIPGMQPAGLAMLGGSQMFGGGGGGTASGGQNDEYLKLLMRALGIEESA